MRNHVLYVLEFDQAELPAVGFLGERSRRSSHGIQLGLLLKQMKFDFMRFLFEPRVVGSWLICPRRIQWRIHDIHSVLMNFR